MRELLDEANEVLQSYFGLCPSLRSFDRLCNVRSGVISFSDFADGFYDVSNHKAYVSDAPSLFHEFHGHALFFEHSMIGKRVAELISNGNISSAVFDKTLLFVEGHAIWTSAFLLDKLGLDDIFTVYEKSLCERNVIFSDGRTLNYQEIYDVMKKAENFYGMHDLWWRVFGFPRKLSKEVLENLVRNLPGLSEKIILAVVFGSRKEYSDVDLCIVVNEKKDFDCLSFRGIIDLAVYDLEEFLAKARLFDVGVTEPILTGDFILGDKNLYERIRQDLSNDVPSREAVEYLRRTSKLLFENASAAKRSGMEEIYLETLAYSISYRLFANAYERGCKSLTFKELCDPELDNVRRKLSNLKRLSLDSLVSSLFIS